MTGIVEAYLPENAGNHSGPENQETAIMLDNEQQEGVTEETYLTVVRASSPSSTSEQAGNLTVVAMISTERIMLHSEPIWMRIRIRLQH